MQVYIDEEAGRMCERPAVVLARNLHRQRFSVSCLSFTASEHEALAQADPAAGRHAALVIGPSRSSEGHDMYYLVRWLAQA